MYVCVKFHLDHAFVRDCLEHVIKDKPDITFGDLTEALAEYLNIDIDAFEGAILQWIDDSQIEAQTKVVTMLGESP